MSPVAELTPVLIWMSDTDKRCTYVNTAWTVFTGRTLESVLADGWREAVHAHDLPRCLEMLDAAFERHQPFTLEYRPAARRRIPMGPHERYPLLAPDGSWTGYVGSSEDVTERATARDPD